MIGGPDDFGSSHESHGLTMRLTNYLDEKAALERKLQNPHVPPQKQAQRRERLRQLESKLIPQLHRRSVY